MNLKERSAVRTTRKKCARCGRTGWYRPRERRCKQMERTAMGKTGYWCYGALAKVVTARRAPRPLVPLLDPRLGIGQVLGEDYQARVAAEILRRGATHRVKYGRQLTAVRIATAKLATRIKRLQTALRKRQQQVRRLERLATLPDAEVEAIRRRAETAARVQQVRRRLLKASGQAGAVDASRQAASASP